ncbi:transposase [Streptomyces maoxianensis]|uniref:Transposase n=1 Tax=Streptomyces maoxianensis TaxID=1459942 RepID=A0ABV9GE24_9ACTN
MRPGQRAARPCDRQVPRRAEYEDPPRSRRSLPPLAFVLTAGQAGDAPAFGDVMARLPVPRRRARPRTRPDVALADKAYSSRTIREHLRKRGIRAVIPVPANQRAAYDEATEAVGHRPSIARHTSSATPSSGCINRLKQWRGIAIRYEKTANPLPRRLHIAGIFIWSAR